MSWKIAACGILLIFLGLAIVPWRGSRVKVVGSLSPKDVVEICRVVSRAEVAMQQPQFPPGTPKLSWRRVRTLPTCFRIRMANRIVSITTEPDGSVKVLSISGLWGERQLRVEKRGGHWFYGGRIEPNPHIIVL
jgi:hypothetical protein